MRIDRMKLRTPLLGEIWLKYQVAQLARILSTLLVGGIPLVQAMETAADSLNTPLLKRAVEAAGKSVREGQPLSGSLSQSKLFPALAIDMIEVGESTGALPSMLNSGRVLRRGCEHEDGGGAIPDRAGDQHRDAWWPSC